ncbi:MAG: galactose-1-phosphate uridylyltransferase [Epulopiscium sp.]|nr:galactose-1-phosphate uridylyltransferase [Candidatus Epulonipiscium sp.]
MSEMRQNKLTGEWIIYAVNRKKRPYDFSKKMEPKKSSPHDCPFCKGNEDKTTDALYEDRGNGEWSVRVFPNMFPAVDENGKVEEASSFYKTAGARGRHEVLVDTPNHTQTIDTFTEGHLEKIFTALQKRFSSFYEEEYIHYIQIFKNGGPEAGMSLSHSHWQIVGLPIVPNRILTQEDAEKEYAQKNHGCLFCDMIKYEEEQQKRVVTENERFIAFTPFASRFSYELWIAPKRHISTFIELEEEDIKALSHMFHKIIKGVSKIREGICYNICFIDAQKGREGDYYHWHIEIMPRVGGFAGLEFSTETYINSILPEEAADFYREHCEE